MQYELNEEQKLLQETVSRIAKDKVAPGAIERDEKEEFPWDMVKILGENGLFGIDFPEKYGGSEAGMLSFCVAVEELSKADASVGVLLLIQELGTLPIMLAGSDRLKEKYLPSLAEGKSLAAFGLTETSGGSDVAGFKTKAVKDGNSYILNGNKIFISNGSVADIVTVYAVTDQEKGAYKGASIFVVEKGTPGFSVGKKENKMGLRASDTSELIFEDCRIPAENLVGVEGQGFHITMKTLDLTRPGVGAQALGLAEGAFEYAKEYAKERVVFGKPVIKHQGIGFMLADMAIEIEAAKQLVYKAAAVLERTPKDMTKLSKNEIMLSAMSKTFASDIAMKVTTDAVQILGGYGYVKEYPVEKMMRDAKITQIYEGTNQIQRLIIMNSL
jgi:alkylation response protein AidB-like acyl-CoA dehydrogenase